MKRNICLCLILMVTALQAQDYQSSFDAIAEAEMKSAIKKTNRTRNANTGNYDLKYHRLELTVDPNVAFLSGAITSHFIAKSDLNSVTFELTNNMVVSKVVQRGVNLSYTQNNNDELIIILPQTQNSGVLDSLTVSYSGNPESSGLNSFEQNYHNGDPIIWTLSEPYGAKGWWPCKQDLNDKIDAVDVYITTPRFNSDNEDYVAVSNGLEQSQTISGQTKTTHFKHQYPIPAYLIAIAITNYSVYSHQVTNNGNPFDIVNYVYPEDLATAQSKTSVTVDIMNLFSDKFESYPFANEKYGHAQFGWNGGMEHTTVSFMGSFNRNLVAHELAHQWFGNKVTCGSWKDIWLNEGFATYLSGLVVEDLDGDANFKTWKEGKINHITSQPSGAVYLQDADTTSVSRVFNSRLSYSKGAMVLHMLRKKLGDSDFYQGVKNYLSSTNHAYGYAKTSDFIFFMESTSGQDLSEFFNDWIYNQGYPSYNVKWNQPSSNQIVLDISQSQSHNSVSFFEADLPIRVHGINGEQMDLLLDHSINNEQFTRSVNFQVATVEFDPEYEIVSKNNLVLSNSKPSLDEVSIKLFPNPTSSQVYIQKPNGIEIYKIELYNIKGQLVDQQFSDAKITLKDLSAGLYFVGIETSLGRIHKSLLKE